jgi:acylpyruvate hydrolase
VRFVTYRESGGGEAVARVEGDQAFRLRGVAGISAESAPDALTAAPAEEIPLPLAGLDLLPVVTRPGKVFCIGLNYRSHIDETGRDVPDYPVIFTKFASSLIGHGTAITLPPESRQVDYEAELAVVIGTAGRRIRREHARDHVLGYTIANDVTMRDFQFKTHQWTPGKAWDGCTPLGPVLVTPDELGDPGKLDISLRLNGTQLQSSGTELLIFDVAELISVISTFTRLEPGDIILTGTPAGVGFQRDPQIFLADGDTVEAEISGIGTLRNTVRAEQVR